MFVYFFHRSMRRDYAKMCKLMSDEDVESGYPEEMFATETTDELTPSPPPPPPGKTAKLSGTECNCHQLSSFLNHFIFFIFFLFIFALQTYIKCLQY